MQFNRVVYKRCLNCGISCMPSRHDKDVLVHYNGNRRCEVKEAGWRGEMKYLDTFAESYRDDGLLPVSDTHERE
jgi:hypothetical protein